MSVTYGKKEYIAQVGPFLKSAVYFKFLRAFDQIWDPGLGCTNEDSYLNEVSTERGANFAHTDGQGHASLSSSCGEKAGSALETGYRVMGFLLTPECCPH